MKDKLYTECRSVVGWVHKATGEPEQEAERAPGNPLGKPASADPTNLIRVMPAEGE